VVLVVGIVPTACLGVKIDEVPTIAEILFWKRF